MTTDQEIQAAARRTSTRLSELGKNEPGNCFYATAVGVAELVRVGFDAAVQAGSCYWRRITHEDSVRRGGRERDWEQFGYEWNPEHPNSKLCMSEGQMPEFHAWAAVRPNAKYPDIARPGELIDFAAHWFPAIVRTPAELTARCIAIRDGVPLTDATPRALDWTAPEPRLPERVTEARMNRRNPDGTPAECSYAADEIATFFVISQLRAVLIKRELTRLTSGMEDVWPAVFGEDGPILDDQSVTTAFKTPAELLRLVTLYFKQRKAS